MTSGDLPRRRGKDPEFQHTVSQWTGPERLVASGATIVVVGNLLVGDMILHDYVISNETWLIALGVLGAMYFFYAGEQTVWHAFYPWIAEIGAWAIALTGAVGFIRAIFDGFPSSGARLLFEIVFYAAAGLAGAGAFQLRSGR
jgi:hypothetical protein